MSTTTYALAILVRGLKCARCQQFESIDVDREFRKRSDHLKGHLIFISNRYTTVLSSMCAVRKWSIDFVEQSHFNKARNWMEAVCHEIKETVSLERCKCRASSPPL